MFDALKTPRRIILSGTPIQNNLEELHAMVRTLLGKEGLMVYSVQQADFCNPGLLGILFEYVKLTS